MVVVSNPIKKTLIWGTKPLAGALPTSYLGFVSLESVSLVLGRIQV